MPKRSFSREQLQLRLQAIERELAALADRSGGVTIDGATFDRAQREADLRDEQDEIEFELASGNLTCGLDPDCD